ncbi:MAG: methyltransferase regulatory domain-containing protein [Anaerolineae bacterium]|nr:MAG: methyltransferase regulatory domain-containing protein [Anaerolineae bacterium]
MDYQPLDHEYDALPYAFLTHRKTHPNYLAVMGSIFGMKPAQPEKCRVLEVGCAIGGNIIPMAYSLPESQILGIDYSANQIQFGREAIESLGLGNIEMERLDIVETPSNLGVFDYIIAHGVYSWVPQPVRESLLALCRRHLAPQGIAYISYNTYPGWHMMEMVREVMLFASKNSADAKEIANRSSHIIDFMIDGIPPGLTAYRSVFETYKRSMDSRKVIGSDEAVSLMFHDELAAFNDPIYFRDFADHAAKHKLQYLSETNFAKVMNPRLTPEILKEIESMSDNLIDFEQFLDFLSNGSFRRTLLVHENVDINRRVRPENVRNFRFMSRARPQSKDPDLSPEVKESFEGSDGAVFTSNHSLSKAAFLYLRENQPKAIPFDTLFEGALNLIEGVDGLNLETEKHSVAASLLQAYSYSSSLVDFESMDSRFITEISDRPLASRVARWQVSKGFQPTNLRHERVEIDLLASTILTSLDGTNNYDDLLNMVVSHYKEGLFKLPDDKVKDAGGPERLLAKELDTYLKFFARSGLLEA